MLVQDIFPGAESSEPGQFTMASGMLFLVADDGLHGRELWRSDGTEEGAVLVQDIRPGPASSTPDWFTIANGTLFFTANDGIHGQELWAMPDPWMDLDQGLNGTERTDLRCGTFPLVRECRLVETPCPSEDGQLQAGE